MGNEERFPFPLDFDHSDFTALLARLVALARGSNLPNGFVPNSTSWLVEDGEIRGVSNLRHTLNDRIRHFGGHNGQGIRPSCRGRRLGNTLMRLTIEQARARGIGKVHIHCHKHKAASARMIIANGGVLHSEITRDDRPEVVQCFVVPANMSPP